jgi:hypothetical protein
MESLSAWILSILGVVILGVLVDLVTAEGKTQRYIRSIFGIITVFVIVLPLPSLVKRDFAYEWNRSVTPAVNYDGAYLESVYREKTAVIERGAQSFLAANGFAGVAVTLSVDGYKADMTVLCVYADTKNAVIAADKAHIDKYSAVRDLLSRYIGVAPEKVTVS